MARGIVPGSWADHGYTFRMTEIVFLVEEDPAGGYTARAAGAAIFTQGDDMDSLKANVRDAVRCHFEESDRPSLIRLHWVRDEVIAA